MKGQVSHLFMKTLFEFGDILHSPIEAFYCNTENFGLPVESHWHYFVEILYMQKNTVTVNCNDISYQLTPGQVILLPPQAMHSIYSENNDFFQYACVKFNLNRIPLIGSYFPNLNYAFHQVLKAECPPIIFTTEELNALDLTELFATIIKESQEKRYGYNAYIYSLLSMLILKILRNWHDRGIHFESKSISENEELNIHDVLVYIDEHSQENINVEELAHHYHMSYSYFAKLFHKHYGQSCKQYIEFVRLNKVENLLLFTDYDLNYIANETGFADCSHLIRTFKKHYQITPKQFRLQHESTTPFSS